LLTVSLTCSPVPLTVTVLPLPKLTTVSLAPLTETLSPVVKTTTSLPPLTVAEEEIDLGLELLGEAIRRSV